MRLPNGLGSSSGAIAAGLALLVAVSASAAPVVPRSCESLTIDAFERTPGTALGLNAYDRGWIDQGTMREPPRLVSTPQGGALEFRPKGGESWLLTYFPCANMSRFDALSFTMTGPAAVYGIGSMTGGCLSSEPMKQWYLPLQFRPTSPTEPFTVTVPFSELFPGAEATSVNLQWLAWQGFPPDTLFRMHEVSVRGKALGCVGSIPGQGAWGDAPPAEGTEDPGPVATIPILPTGPRPYADLAPSYLWEACPQGGFALTYDDGPWRYTNDLLDILKENDVKATFFINGNNKGNIDDHVNVIRKAIADGHTIASHTWGHTSLSNLPETGIFDEMQKLSAKIHEIIGVYPTLMRPPFGAGWEDDRVRGALGKLGYHIIMYEIDANDYAVQEGVKSMAEAEKYYEDYFKYGNGAKKSGVLSLTHDVLPKTVYNLTQFIIDQVKANGYRFVSVEDCINLQDNQGWKSYSDTAALSNGTIYFPA